MGKGVSRLRAAGSLDWALWLPVCSVGPSEGDEVHGLQERQREQQQQQPRGVLDQQAYAPTPDQFICGKRMGRTGRAGLERGRTQSKGAFPWGGWRHGVLAATRASLVEPTIFPICRFLSPSGASLVAQTVKNLPATQKTQVGSLGWEDPLEKGMATQSGILAWRISRTEPSGLQSMRSQRVGHD